MTIVVADASVSIKWLLPERGEESNVGEALDLLKQVRSNRIALYQPPHWLAEIGAVVARLSPDTAQEKISLMYEIPYAVVDTPAIYSIACRLSIEFNHHLFDTLYHAVALEIEDAFLITADEKYYDKARVRGRLVRLGELNRLSST